MKFAEDKSMDMKKAVGAVVGAFVLLVAGRYLIHEVWLKPDYMMHADTMRSDAAILHRMWILQVSNFLVAFAAVMIYLRGVENKSWVGQGIRFGILLALVGVIPQSLIEYSVYPVPYMMAVKWMIGESGLAVLMSLLIAMICQPKTQSA
jgi:hypothetical protein